MQVILKWILLIVVISVIVLHILRMILKPTSETPEKITILDIAKLFFYFYIFNGIKQEKLLYSPVSYIIPITLSIVLTSVIIIGLIIIFNEGSYLFAKNETKNIKYKKNAVIKIIIAMGAVIGSIIILCYL